MNMKSWWSEVPESSRSKLTFYNHPVSAEEFENVLNKSVKQSDYVVVKLDIDTPAVEMEILDVVDRHAHLIDEFFFELHFWFDGLDFGWNLQRNTPGLANVTTAVQTM